MVKLINFKHLALNFLDGGKQGSIQSSDFALTRPSVQTISLLEENW